MNHLVLAARPERRRLLVKRLRPVITGIVRLTAAVVIAFVLTSSLLSSPAPVTGPLTALLVVQATLFATMATGARKVGAVLTGVLLAVGISTVVGLTWWSLGLVVASALVVARLLPLKDQELEVAISAMLILAVSGSEVVAELRVVETLVGAAVGIALNLLFPPRLHTPQATEAVEEVALKTADTLDRSAEKLAGAVRPSDLATWAHELRDIVPLVGEAQTAIDDLSRSRRLNARAVSTPDASDPLRTGLSTIEHVLVAVRALYISMADGVPELRQPALESEPSVESEYASDLRAAFAVVLIDVSDTLRAFTTLVMAEAAFEGTQADAALEATLERLRETRAILTDLLLSHGDSDEAHWLTRGPVVAAIERILRELDIADWQRHRRDWAAEAERRAPVADALARLRDVPLPAWMLRG
ncbi:MAG TPA: FUSC family protein [Candidatus Lustribacter sp.]|nr:FUSC family protein [Candidatus Lustribacter sp.]